MKITSLIAISVFFLSLPASQAIALEKGEEKIEVMSAEEIEKRIQGRDEIEHNQGINDEMREARVPDFAPPTGDSVADLIARLTYMEEELRRLNGQVAQLQFELRNVSEKADEASKTAKQAREKSLSSAAEQYVTKTGDVNEKYVIKVDGSEVEVADDEQNLDPAMKEETDFNAAVALISEQNLAEAKSKFANFIKSYPASIKIADAYFWLGEISMDEAKYKESALNYLKSYKADKQGKRAEEALLKSSTALGKLGKKDEACKNLNTLKNMEGLQDLIKEQASSEAIKLGCK